MEDNKRVIVLVTIALILATTAIALNVMDSDEIPTSKVTQEGAQDGTGELGIDIQPSPVEDKLTEQEQLQ